MERSSDSVLCAWNDAAGRPMKVERAVGGSVETEWVWGDGQGEPLRESTKSSAKPTTSRTSTPTIPNSSTSSSSSSHHGRAKPKGRKRRRPEPKCFPEQLRDFIYAPSSDGVDENLVILLHGLGDTHHKYAQLAKAMNLPQTASLALRAPLAMPFELGFSWFQVLDMSAGEYIQPSHDPDDNCRAASLLHTRGLMLQLLRALQTEAGGAWCQDGIFLMGFSMGGTVCVDLALALTAEHSAEGSSSSSSSCAQHPAPPLAFAGPLAPPRSSPSRPLGGMVVICAEALPELVASYSGTEGMNGTDRNSSRRSRSRSRGTGDPSTADGEDGSGSRRGEGRRKGQGEAIPALFISGSVDSTVPPLAVERTAALYQRATATGSPTAASDEEARMGREEETKTKTKTKEEKDKEREKEQDTEQEEQQDEVVQDEVVQDEVVQDEVVGYHCVQGKGHSLLNGEVEVRCVMGFWGRHLRRRLTELEDDEEVLEVGVDAAVADRET